MREGVVSLEAYDLVMRDRERLIAERDEARKAVLKFFDRTMELSADAAELRAEMAILKGEHADALAQVNIYRNLTETKE